MNSELPPDLSAKLFVRADPESGTERQRQRIADQLSELEREGVLDSYEVIVWGRELRLQGALAGSEYHRTVLDHVESFDEWATRTGASLDPLFQRDHVESTLADEAYDRIALPVACLAVYRADDLDGVFPCRTAGGLCTILDYLEHVASDEPSATAESLPF